MANIKENKKSAIKDLMTLFGTPERLQILEDRGLNSDAWMAIASAYLGVDKDIQIACDPDKNPNAATNKINLVAALVKCASAGLYPDGKEVYIGAWGKEVLSITVIFMANGLKRLAAQRGYIIDAFPIKDNQNPVLVIENGRQIIKTDPVNPFEKSTSIIGWIATAHDKNTGELVSMLPINLDDIEKRRDISRSYQSGKKSGQKSIWEEWSFEMHKKTCIRIIFSTLCGGDVQNSDDGDYLDETKIGGIKSEFQDIQPSPTPQPLKQKIEDLSIEPLPNGDEL